MKYIANLMLAFSSASFVVVALVSNPDAAPICFGAAVFFGFAAVIPND